MEDWLWGAVDILASEYGWTQRDILYKTYPEEFFLLQRRIKIRKTDDYLIQLSIVSNPHKDPEQAKEFVDSLVAQSRFYHGDQDVPDELDVAAFESIRNQLAENSKAIKVK